MGQKHQFFCSWPNNNILASLFCAEEHMREGFVCSYADILYRGSVVRRALEHEGDIVLCVDTQWRPRYAERTQHPEDAHRFAKFVSTPPAQTILHQYGFLPPTGFAAL